MGSKVSVQFSASACIFLALALLILPLRWLLAAVLAASFHELCHLAAIMLCGGEVLGFTVGGQGAAIQIAPMSRGKELICALAGPFGGLLLLLFARWIPRTALCAAFHSLYNLLPIFPLDGGRALGCTAALLLPPDRAEKMCAWVQRLCGFALAALGIWGCFWLKLGILPLMAAVLMLIRTNCVKIPCKRSVPGVQ